MNYFESIKYLDQTSKKGCVYGTETMKQLLKRLGNPEQELKVIHVAGTNGKGSVTHLLKNILVASRLKVGLYNSPYILSYKETITINNEEISDDTFAYSASAVKSCCDIMQKEGLSLPTVFECVTAIALHFFSLSKVDVAIIEVGLGGLDDATNVFSSPLLSIITSINFDHTDILGNSLESIAKVKAGIIKDKCPVVLGVNTLPVVKVIKEYAEMKQSNFYYCDSNFIKKVKVTDNYHTTLTVHAPSFIYDDLITPLLGHHQHENILTALMAIHVLKGYFSIPKEAVYKGIENTTIAGRCEYINLPKKLLLDVAHNKESVQALTSILDTTFSNTSICFLFGGLADKDIEAMLKLLSNYSKNIIVTEPLSNRAMLIETLAPLASKYFENVIAIKDLLEAYKVSIEKYEDNTLLCVTGSFYLTLPITKVAMLR